MIRLDPGDVDESGRVLRHCLLRLLVVGLRGGEEQEQEQRHDDGTTWVLTAAAAHWESAATFLLAVITCWRTVRWDVGEQEQWSRAPQP